MTSILHQPFYVLIVMVSLHQPGWVLSVLWLWLGVGEKIRKYIDRLLVVYSIFLFRCPVSGVSDSSFMFYNKSLSHGWFSGTLIQYCLDLNKILCTLKSKTLQYNRINLGGFNKPSLINKIHTMRSAHTLEH